MKFSLPMYDGDSFLRYRSQNESEALRSVVEADSTPEMLHRKIRAPQPELPVFEHAEIDRQARALRAAALRDIAVSTWRWVERVFATARRRRAEEYLARAQSVAELESRLRKLERHGHLLRV
jgi:hypothetical protein